MFDQCALERGQIGTITRVRHAHDMHAMRAKLADAMGETVRRLGYAGLEIWTRPRAGVFVWARLPDSLDAADVARHALAGGVVFAPGNVFSASQSAGSFLRFNVSQCNRPKVYDELHRAMEKSAAAQTRERERA